jgi:predicted anti-sigma-YlaC factor YlaD
MEYEYREGSRSMPINETLSCQEVVELITDYLENALLAEMRKRLEEHVAQCPGCQTYIEQIQQTISMLHQIAKQQVAPATKQELLQFFHSWK